jgi:hypothetical protein
MSLSNRSDDGIYAADHEEDEASIAHGPDGLTKSNNNLVETLQRREEANHSGYSHEPKELDVGDCLR